MRDPKPAACPDALGAAERRSEETLRPHVVLDEADDCRKTQGNLTTLCL